MIFNKKIAGTGLSCYGHPEIAINAGGLKFNADVMIAPILVLILNEPFNLNTNSSCQNIREDGRAFISFNTPSDACEFLKVAAYNLTDFTEWEIDIGNIGTVNDQFTININVIFPHKDIDQIIDNLNFIKSGLILTGLKLGKEAVDELPDAVFYEMKMSSNAASVLAILIVLNDTSKKCGFSDFPYATRDQIWPINKRKDRDPHTTITRNPKKFKSD